MATTLRLESVRPGGFECRLARLGGGRLTRVAGAIYLEIDHEIEDARYQLALAGIRVTHSPGMIATTTGRRPAIALDLVPLGRGLEAIEVVEVRPIPLSDSTAALMRRRLPWSGGSRRSREACRRLLRDEDTVLGWRRIVWCSMASLRAARARGRLRPVVFDRAAVADRPFRWTYASDGAIEHWAFT